MLRNAGRLSDAYEYAIIHWGQSNARPWGHPDEAYGEEPALELRTAGLALTVASYTGSDLAGETAIITISGTTLIANDWVGAELRLGTISTPLVGYGTVLENSATTVTVRWNSDFDATGLASATGCWLHLNDRWKAIDTVRVLTPWLPEEPGDYPEGAPAIPGYDFESAGITSYEDCALFLPWSRLEGVQGPGTTGLGHASTAPTATTFTADASVGTTNLYGGGYIRVGDSRGRIKSHTGAVVTLTDDGWIGGTPGLAEEFEIHVGHFENSPYHADPGYGFRWPNNDPQPCPINSDSGYLYNRPAGYTTKQYGTKFGEMRVLAARLSTIFGVRIHVIHLGINSASQVLRNSNNWFGFQGQLGWWNDDQFLDWTPANPTGSAARLKKLITVSAPGALLAEGNTKPLKILAIRGSQGEGDSGTDEGRDTFGHSLATFYTWLRGVIEEAGMSAYPSGVKIPVCHSKITHVPYELTGDFEYYNALAGLTLYITLDGDDEGKINAGISDFVTRDGAACTIETDDSPKLGDTSLANGIDPLHFDGVGEVRNGRAAADALAPLINAQLNHNGLKGQEVVDICNLALSHIGVSPRVTSIDPSDNSYEATLCALYFPKAVKDLLELHRWKFASKRVALTEVTSDLTEYEFAYAPPIDMLSATAILPDGAPDDVSSLPASVIFLPDTVQLPDRDFVIEVDSSGYDVLLTDVEDAHLRYQSHVTDVSRFPPLFKTALSWYLAHFLAGAVVKGDAGAKLAESCLRRMGMFLSSASTSNSRQRRINPRRIPDFIAKR